MKRIIVILINVFFLLPISISATTKATPCEFSEAYLEWLNLTSIEQSIIPMPTICKNDEPFQPYYQNQNLFNYSVKATYPSKYDSRNVDGKNYVSPVRNQMSTGACWAFSALATVESYSMKYFNDNTIYSPRHIDYSTSRYFLNNVTNPESFNRTVGQGGNGYMASSYLINGKGPITESQMPFENNENLININSIKNKTVNLDVNGYEIIENSSLGCSTTIKNKIKEHIMQYGSMAASIYMTTNSSYYRASSHALNYNSTSAQDFYAPNHAITIIGWDDNFSRNLFAAGHQPSSNGAWIVKNSYGTNWSYGDNGYFYISYEDDWVCQNPTGATSIDQEVEDKIYYHDVLGYNSYYGYNDSQAAAVNIFELETSQELLEEVTFVAKENTNYVIYLNPQDDDLNLDKFIKIGSGKTTYAGYHTYKLSKPYLLENKKFAIMVSYDLEDGTHPIGTQIVSGTFFDKGNTTPELSYVSSSINGPWEDLSDEIRYQPFASIKGSTNQINYNFQISQPQITPDYPYTNGEFNITIPFTSTNVELDSLQINILNSQNKNVTNDFNVVKASNKITISSKGSSLLSDDYEVSINYQEITRTMSFHLYEQFEIYPQDIVTNTNMYNTNENNIDIPVNTVGYEDNYELEIIVKNSSGNDVTKELNITNNTIINNKAKIHIVIPKDTLPDTYTVTIKGEKSATTEFIIIDYVPLESIRITPIHNQIKIGQTQKYTVTYTPSNATNKKITWRVSNPNIATIKDNTITAIARGELTVTATSVENPDITSNAGLTIIDPIINLTSATIIGENELDRKALFTGSEGKITLNIQTQDIFSSKLTVKIFNSSNNQVSYFNIDNGEITNNKSTIIINSSGNAPAGLYIVKIFGANARTFEYQFRINQPIKVSSIKFNDIRTSQNMTINLNPTISPINAYNQTLKYTVDNPNIATIKNNQLTTLRPGETTITATSTDGSNIKTSFKLTVTDSIFLNSNYTITKNYIGNIKEKTSYQSFYNSLNISSNERVKIYNTTKTKEVSSGYIGTGMIIEKKSGTEVYNYTLVVKGDISGDGIIGSFDVLQLRRYIVRLATLSEPAKLAADVNGDNSVGSLDALKMRRHIVKIEYIY